MNAGGCYEKTNPRTADFADRKGTNGKIEPDFKNIDVIRGYSD